MKMTKSLFVGLVSLSLCPVTPVLSEEAPKLREALAPYGASLRQSRSTVQSTLASARQDPALQQALAPYRADLQTALSLTRIGRDALSSSDRARRDALRAQDRTGRDVLRTTDVGTREVLHNLRIDPSVQDAWAPFRAQIQGAVLEARTTVQTAATDPAVQATMPAVSSRIERRLSTTATPDSGEAAAPARSATPTEPSL